MNHPPPPTRSPLKLRCGCCGCLLSLIPLLLLAGLTWYLMATGLRGLGYLLLAAFLGLLGLVLVLRLLVGAARSRRYALMQGSTIKILACREIETIFEAGGGAETRLELELLISPVQPQIRWEPRHLALQQPGRGILGTARPLPLKKIRLRHEQGITEGAIGTVQGSATLIMDILVTGELPSQLHLLYGSQPLAELPIVIKS